MEYDPLFNPDPEWNRSSSIVQKQSCGLRHGGQMVALPILMGSLATLLVYRYWPRRSDAAVEASAARSAWSIDPMVGPATVGLRLRFEIR